MKKLILTALLLGFVLAAAGCGSSNDASVNLPPEKATYSVTADEYSGDYDYEDVVIAKYTFSLPKLTASSEEGKDVADTFNKVMEDYADILVDDFMDNVYSAAKADYLAKKESGTPWGDTYYSYEVKYTDIQVESYLGVAFDIYLNTGGAHPNTNFRALMYDLNEGKFFTYKDLSDKPDEMRAAIAADLIRQMQEQGLSQNYFDGYESEVESLENAEMYFTEDGITVVFPDYVLGPHTVGPQTLLVDYSVVDPYLNDYAMTILYEFTGVVG